MHEGPCSPVPRPLQPLRHSWLRPLTLAEQLQAPPLLANLQAQHLLQHLLPLGLLCQPHPLQLLRVQAQQCPAWGVKPRSASGGHQEHGREREVGRGAQTQRQGEGDREREMEEETDQFRDSGREKETRTDRDREEKRPMKTDRQTGRHSERFCRDTDLKETLSQEDTERRG